MTAKREYLDYVQDIYDSIVDIETFIHEYFGVDKAILWKVAAEEIPPLKSIFRRILKDER